MLTPDLGPGFFYAIGEMKYFHKRIAACCICSRNKSKRNGSYRQQGAAAIQK
jgi:hypothetical protein